jgi:hypothetical protein
MVILRLLDEQLTIVPGVSSANHQLTAIYILDLSSSFN